MTKYFEIMSAIKAGNYKPRSLWMGLSSPNDRDGYALGALFTGRGQYQRIEVANEDLLINVSDIIRWSRLCLNCDYPLTEKWSQKENLRFVCSNCGQEHESHFTSNKPFKVNLR